MTRKFSVFLFLVLVTLTTRAVTFAAGDATVLKEGEQLFSEDYDRVWDATITTITEMGFATHPHKKMKHKKKKGRIKTPEWRYFKIWSAQPVISKQYKDSYKIQLKKIEIEVPQPAAEKKEEVAPKADAAAKETSAPDKSAKETAKQAEGMPADKPEDGAGTAVAEPAAPPIPTITKVKVSIKRKFLVHNDATRKWDKGDPKKEKVGYTVASILEEIKTRLANNNTSVDQAKIPNNNINPPPIGEGIHP